MATNPKQSGQGRAKDPENDGRMKDNKSGAQGTSQSHGQGQVKDPKTDGRLKENRDK